MKKVRIISDGLWVFSGQMASAIAILASVRILTEYLAPAELGLMALLIGLASILIGLVLGPLGQSMLVNFSRYNKINQAAQFRHVGAAIFRNFTIGALSAIILVGLPCALYFGLHWSAPFLVAAFFVIEAKRYFELILFIAKRRQRSVAFIYAADAWLRLACVWIFLHHIVANAYMAIAGNLTGGLILISVIQLATRTEDYSRTKTVERTDFDSIRSSIKKLAMPLFPAAFLTNVADMGNRYFIAGIIGLGEAGIFSLTYGLVKRPFGMLNSITDFTMKPMLSNAISENDTVEISEIRLLWFLGGAAVAIVGAVLFYLLRETIVDLLMAEEYRQATKLIGWIALGVAFFNIANIFNAFSLALGNSKAALISTAFGAVFSVVLTVPFLWHFGVLGAALAMPIFYAVQLVVAVILFRITLDKSNVTYCP